VAYRLELPASWRIHNVFHASLLSPYQETAAHGPNFSRPPPDLIDGEEEFEVERITSHQHHGRSRTLQYLIKWKGYPESDNTWEPASQIHAPDILKAYHRKRPLELIKTALTRCSKIISPHWIPPLHSSNSFDCTDTSPLHALSLSLSTTPTRNWTFPSSDIQSHLQSLSTVPVFPGRLRRPVLSCPQHTTSVQVAVIPRETPTPLPPTRTTRPRSCPTDPSTPQSSPPSTTLLDGTRPMLCQSRHHLEAPPSSTLLPSPPPSHLTRLSPSSTATLMTASIPTRFEPSRKGSQSRYNSVRHIMHSRDIGTSRG
jgi:hypothetical protein